MSKMWKANEMTNDGKQAMAQADLEQSSSWANNVWMESKGPDDTLNRMIWIGTLTAIQEALFRLTVSLHIKLGYRP